MSELLQSGQTVQSLSGKPCTVIKFLGGGGQGEVYKANWAGGEYALKWYFLPSATPEQRDSLKELIAGSIPSDKFLWPLDLAEADGVPGFGYIMRLRSPNYKSLIDLMAGRVTIDFMPLITAGLELAKAFRDLHTSGLCYRDISFGNAFFDPINGDVMVCDNDNVVTNRTNKGGVLGTPDFMAPEVVRGDAVPSRETDLFSLAVLLFYMLHVGHPLVGKKILGIHSWDPASRLLLFGKEPVFIFDPTDHSNEAVDKNADPTGEAGATAITYWTMYPQFLKNVFIKAFTTGVRNPSDRVTELEWLGTMAALRNSIFKCACGKSNFYDPDAVKATGGHTSKCWFCKQEPRLPYRIRIGKSIIMLNSDSKLYPHHMGDGRDFDFSKPVAEVTRHPTDPNLWGLKNLGTQKWVATMPGGALKDVEPAKSAPLVPNVKVNFGKVEGEIRY